MVAVLSTLDLASSTSKTPASVPSESQELPRAPAKIPSVVRLRGGVSKTSDSSSEGVCRRLVVKNRPSGLGCLGLSRLLVLGDMCS